MLCRPCRCYHVRLAVSWNNWCKKKKKKEFRHSTEKPCQVIDPKYCTRVSHSPSIVSVEVRRKAMLLCWFKFMDVIFNKFRHCSCCYISTTVFFFFFLFIALRQKVLPIIKCGGFGKLVHLDFIHVLHKKTRTKREMETRLSFCVHCTCEV